MSTDTRNAARREFWLFRGRCLDCDGVSLVAYDNPPWPKEEGTHVREVLPGEIALTELELNYILDRTSLRLEQVIEVLRAVFPEGPTRGESEQT